MKRIPIFRAGKHTPTSGAALDFSTDDLKAAVAAYDPSLHEAPIVVGHPKDNHPAFGWIDRLEFDEGTGEIVAIPKQVDPAFAEIVDAGRYKKRSASWYLPDSPANPKPGTLYLRHVGFLGAQPPAVKGLGAVQFSASDEGVIEFGDSENRWAFGSIASAIRSFREWIIGEKGVEAADKVIPNYVINDIERAAQAAATDSPAAVPAFSEEDDMNIAELQAQVARLTAENATLKTQAAAVANFAEREASLAAREAAVAQSEANLGRATIERRVDAAIAAGRLLKAQREQVIAFAASLADGEQTFDFAEAPDKTVKVSQREIYLRTIEKGAKVVDFGERSGSNGKQEEPGAADEASFAEAQDKLRKQVMGA